MSAEPEQGDVPALADVVPVQLEIQPDPDVGLVTIKIIEAGRPEVEVDLGPSGSARYGNEDRRIDHTTSRTLAAPIKTLADSGTPICSAFCAHGARCLR